MSKKQTAVEWLIIQIKNDHTQQALTDLEWAKVFEQAQAMEKEQIMNTWAYGVLSQGDKTAEQYYNETYGGENE